MDQCEEMPESTPELEFWSYMPGLEALKRAMARMKARTNPNYVLGLMELLDDVVEVRYNIPLLEIAELHRGFYPRDYPQKVENPMMACYLEGLYFQVVSLENEIHATLSALLGGRLDASEQIHLYVSSMRQFYAREAGISELVELAAA
jgi:hypothetical protein